MDVRFINCEACQTEGRMLTNDGGPDDVDHGVCPECNGKRVVEVETWPTRPLRPLGRIIYGPPGSGWWEYES